MTHRVACDPNPSTRGEFYEKLKEIGMSAPAWKEIQRRAYEGIPTPCC